MRRQVAWVDEKREGRWSFRAWLYRIATNACLDHVARGGRRVLPVDVAPAADPEGDVPAAAAGVRWLEPYPDRLVDPHEAAVARETLEIGFVAAIQHLPPRQRAALILRDVAGFSARETAELLDTSVPAVNSALQRARDRLRERLPSRRDEWPRSDPPAEQREVARLYVEAIERRDFAALAALVREDVRFSFPPRPLWYDGLDAFRRGSEKHAAPGEHLFVAARANLQPAVALYGAPDLESAVCVSAGWSVFALRDGAVYNTYRVYPHSRLITPLFSGLLELVPNKE
jgi:RNA polymerase sigma-70 factor (ECF subfamily)